MSYKLSEQMQDAMPLFEEEERGLNPLHEFFFNAINGYPEKHIRAFMQPFKCVYHDISCGIGLTRYCTYQFIAGDIIF